MMDAPLRWEPSGRVILTRPQALTLECWVHLSADCVSINTFQMSAVKQRCVMTAIFSRRASRTGTELFQSSLHGAADQ